MATLKFKGDYIHINRFKIDATGIRSINYKLLTPNSDICMMLQYSWDSDVEFVCSLKQANKIVKFVKGRWHGKAEIT